MTMANKQTPGQRMIASAKQALAFAAGEDNGCVVHIPDDIDVARIRGKVNMSQGQFAAHFGVSVRTVQEWEQGRAVPSGPSRALLIVIDREPTAVRRALVSSTIGAGGAHESQRIHT
jgi:putative transcriptional regulator